MQIRVVASTIGTGARAKRTPNSNSPPLKTPKFQFSGNLDKLCKFMQIRVVPVPLVFIKYLRFKLGTGARAKRTVPFGSGARKTPKFQFSGNLDKLCKFMQIMGGAGTIGTGARCKTDPKFEFPTPENPLIPVFR